MLTDIQHQLGKNWIFGFENLRIADTSVNDGEIVEVYAIDFYAREDETVTQFLTRFCQQTARLQAKFVLIGACLEFQDSMFAIVEFGVQE